MNARTLSLALALSLGATLASAQAAPVPAAPAPATTTPPKDTSLDKAIALFRTDLRAQKAALLGKALALSEAEAKVFWPLHKQFEQETAKLWDERIKIISDYATAYETLNDATAVALSERVFKWEEQRLKLNRDQFAIFSKQLPGKTVAHFFQLDGYLNRVIELQIAGVMPEIRQIKQ